MKNRESISTTEKRIKIVVACVLVAGFCCLLLHSYFCVRGHGGATVETVVFEMSDKKLKNPNRGFYFMHGYYIYDDMMDFREPVARDYCMDDETTITLIEINLAEFKKGPISSRGLLNIDSLFASLHGINKRLIVRFLYDWDGENEGNEPEDLSIILGHMEQLGPVVNAHADDIFILQGLFIGNWGEMNGTKYANRMDINTLANTLARVTDPNIYLAVRMPMHWRMATDCDYDSTLAKRLSLFNDGMLGSASDYGTYGEQSKIDVGEYSYWNREEELEFQSVLCSGVPNGGEVICPNSYNDLDNAIADFSRMHVTYLNNAFDVRVYDKWNRECVSTGDVFDGQTGKLYMDNLLGYRLIIADNQMKYHARKDELSISVDFQNIGFAPLYQEPKVMLLIINKETGERITRPVATSLCSLPGGIKKEETVSVDTVFSMRGQQKGTYEVYFYMEDEASGMPISLGVKQDLTENGYLLGTITLDGKMF